MAKAKSDSDALAIRSLSRGISKSQQDVRYQELLSFDGHRLRIRIRSNPYDFQCSATIEVWSYSLDKWSEVWALESMQTAVGLYHSDSYALFGNFAADREDLLQHARRILSDSNV